MDGAKKLNQLDPKLKEAYERVMQTTVTPPKPQAPEPATPAAPKVAVEPTTTVKIADLPETPSPKTSSASTVFKAGVLKAKKSAGIPPFAYIILGIIFFVVYAFVWIKVLNLKLPFLP